MLVACWASFCSLLVYAAIRQDVLGPTYSEAVHTTFFLAYDYPQFVIALGALLCAREDACVLARVQGMTPMPLDPAQRRQCTQPGL